ncbi:MAG: hypothetical protein POELPBGB_03222 [Bacteroidia bacterium]|nr:hypothetical protein [Bacteroidia bacterium]
MNSKQEDKFGMFVKTELFLLDNAATLSVNPAIVTLQGLLTGNINDIIQADSTATRNLTGVTQDKNQYRSAVELSMLTIAGAARGYYTTNPDLSKKRMVTFTKTDVALLRDSDVIVKADQVHDIADPIKTLLTPWGVMEADVINLPLVVNTYRQWLQKPAQERNISTVAGINVDKEFADTEKVLSDLDDQLAVLEYTNNLLYLSYKLSRAIDDSGGNSGSEGYDVTNVTIPAGGVVSLPLNLGSGANPDPNVYLRVIGGNSGIQLSTSNDNNPSTPIYTLQAGITFKGAISGLGLDLNKPNLIAHNPGTGSVVVRAGNKVNP